MTVEDRRIGQEIRELRKQRDNMSQTALAELMTEFGQPMQQQTILKIEKGTRALKLSEAIVMASALKTSLLTLVPATDERKQIDEAMWLAREVRKAGYDGVTLLVEAEGIAASLRETLEAMPDKVRAMVTDYAEEASGQTAQELFDWHIGPVRKYET